ncbi:RimJ/RimL family protein N-acetyltransferase [Allocatelliglobosispora scoriae]|uniref:RimJ/RimL family protein N-acetyltransferase n=1 Tax=Allocatelliglobosispora scoriae TaxID=643052 RepID=A0A841BU10_9ACTN|nr:GNAT family N-acetyltransferase [Allocatelliglobosispora scoriae]MBB5870232.1 RimJ/RimL family protein N-acetyltransferase [Allocatelliglobosispora scoriae]
MTDLPEIIKGDGVVLRAPRPTDAPDVARALGDEETSRYLASVPHPVTLEWAEGWVGASSLAIWEHGVTRYVVTDPASGELLGGVGLRRVQHDRLQAETGYWTAPWARGRGVATAATTALAGAAFEAGFARLEALAEWSNISSQRVALAAGFKREGVRRGAGTAPDGSRYDLIAFARLRNDPAGPIRRVIPDLPGGFLTDGVIKIRPLYTADADHMYDLHTLPEVLETSVGAVTTREEFKQRAERSFPMWLAGERADMLIFDAVTGDFAGDIGFWYGEPMTGQGMIGYALMPAHRGRGFATRAANLVATWLFETVGVERLIAGTEPNNTNSQKVLERAGFTREAFLKSRLPGNNDGERIDDIQFVRFPGDK